MAAEQGREALARALGEIRTLRTRLREPIAIVGAGCRFPGGVRSLDDYWRLLRDGVDAVTALPPSRWNAARYAEAISAGGYLDDVETFDASFFGIAPREAARIDPQQRLLLEVSWEALENAGIAADRISGSITGLYTGVMNNDYAFRQAHALRDDTIDPHMLSGGEPSFSAGRLAYFLGLHGPAMAVATACSSSLVSVHLACQALRAGECDLALAGGVNVIVDPVTSVMLTRLGALAADGRCKTFDARADGYGRGEGCGMVVLERLSDALRNGRDILAIIRGSAVAHDGASAGLTVPNGSAQELLLRRTLAAADVAPHEIGYVEAHGTGTALGDPIEVASLARVLGTPERRAPLLLGSVKTNFGHLEAAAGVAGLLKCALAMRERHLPPHLHFRTPNAHVPWHELPVAVVTSLREWTPGLAGVSSFGLSGINAHAVLEPSPLAPRTVEEPSPRLLTLSARTPGALEEQRGRFAAFVAAHSEQWADICFTANTGRVHFEHRLAIVASTADEALQELHGGPAKAPPAFADVIQLYTAGSEIDFEALHAHERERRRPLAIPAYPFQHERHWVLDTEREAPAAAQPADLAGRVQTILGLAAPPAADVPLVSLGLDSLMAMELREAAGVDVSVRELLGGLTLADLTARVRPERYPLSEGQKALWFIHESDPESPAYNVALAFRLREPIDPDALRDALQRLTDRHEALRTTFTVEDGRPLQEVHASMPVAFAVVDGDEPSLRDAVRVPFDLRRGPLMRVTLFTRGELLFVFHHLICDAVSCWTLLEELNIVRPSARPNAPAFREFVAREAAMLAGEGERHLAYWRDELAGEVPLLDLPADFPRPATPSLDGGSVRITIGEPLTRALRELARATNCTLYVTLLAAFQLLLHRLSRQDEVVVGSATSARPSGFERTVGYFVNPVPLRARFAAGTSFRDLLGAVRRTVSAALEHQQYPFPVLVRELRPRREPGRSPLFQADFALAKAAPAYRPRVAALPIEPLDLEEEEGQFELALHVREDERELTATFKYQRALFRPETVERFAGAFITLLESIAADPGAAIDRLSLVSMAERERLLALGEGPRVPLPDTFLHELLVEQAVRAPNSVAVVSGTTSLNFRELIHRGFQVSRELRERGVVPETIVAVTASRSCDLVVALFGVLAAGGAYLPIDPSYPEERREFMLRDSGAALHINERLEIETLRQVAPRADVALRPDHLAYVIYTSGSTGTPKGTLITQRGLLNYLLWAIDAYRVAEGAGAPVHSTIGFDATITSLWAPLLAGTPVVILPDSVEALRDAQPPGRPFSLLKITPAHLELLAHLLRPDELRGRANAVVIGGEALRGEMLARWLENAPETRFINEYGPTETVVGCCVYETRQREGNVPIGRPIANTTLRVLDAQRQLVPAGVVGELYIGGAGVARGYLNRPELTAERFVEIDGQRFYRTGDLVRWRFDDQLEYRGRNDTQVKVRGFRVELGEIESVLERHAGVAQCVADLRDGQLVAWFTGSATPSELRHFLSERLPSSMVPSFFLPLPSLPLTPNGKVDRNALPAPDARGQRPFVAPRNGLEMQLAAIWEEVLGVRPVGVRDDFFDLGGHSLLAVRLVARLRDALDRDVALAALLRAPTIAQLAGSLAEETSAASPLVPMQSGGTRPPFFCIPGAGGNAVYLYALARQLPPEQPFFGMQGAGVDGEAPPHTTVEEMAAYYVDAIRTAQPRGPYHLGGHSLGGWVAFEMAQQLRRAGEEVALVAVIDTPSPHHRDATDRSTWDDARWIAELSFRIGQLLRPEAILEAEPLRGLPPDEQLRAFRDALVRADLYPADAGFRLLRGILRMFKAHAGATYTLPDAAHPVPIALLRTRVAPPHLHVSPDDETWGWGVLGPVDVDVLPGEHLSILRPPHVHALADALAARLEKGCVWPLARF